MKLSNRILLLIAPVILFSAGLSNYIIYSVQKDALIRRTDSYLELNMQKLAGYYKQTASLLNSYSYTLSKSDIIQHYIFNQHNPFRELELVDNLHSTIHELQPDNDSFVALSILDANSDVLYYAERSDDPFASIDDKLLQEVRKEYYEEKRLSYLGYMTDSNQQGGILRFDVLDTSTLQKPLSYDSRNVFFIVVFSKLTQFNTLKHALEKDNDSPILLGTATTDGKRSPVKQTVELQPGFYASLKPAPYILQNKLHDMQKDLFVSFGASSVLTVIILLILLYRHVTSPISRLDLQLSEVENKKRRNIEVLTSKDEIGRLSVRFHAMYSELEETYRKTKTLAENDHLTKLANRRQFNRHAELVLSQEYKGVWVLYIDLDNFKYVNDRYGHQVGDSLLVSFSKHVKHLCREFNISHQVSGLASRLSGDEFAVLLHTAFEEPDCADDFALRLLQPIQEKSNNLLGNFPVTASVGIATYPQDGETITDLLSNADTAMYQAKKAGKNQISHYSSELDKVVQRRSSIEQALRAGHYDDEFKLVYQPYFNCTNGAIAGFEVLLRWQSQSLGEVSPEEFIPIAEQTGIFGSIDRWVIKTAFAEFEGVQDLLAQPRKIAINLSAAELNSLPLADYIETYAKQYNVPVDLIEFEITETFASDSQGFPLLRQLAELGFDLTMDDFGSGYTSITQLVQYPVQKIKLDRQFIDTLLETDKKNIIKPLIDLCHAQGMLVTAEGVETQQMQSWLSDYHCDYLQGFYFGKPMSLEELKNWMENRPLGANYDNSDHYVA